MLRLLGFILLGSVLLAAAERPIPVILDTDIGDDIDDALALALAVRSPELDVRAVVTVLQQRERRADLAWKILELHGRTDIPIGLGAEQPLMARPSTGPVRQAAALGPNDRMPDEKRRNGIELMIETCLRAPEKITVLAYGPLTNVALALRAEPRIADKIERLVLMNGAFFKAPRVEYNTERDPEAAAIVFGSGLPITVVGLDVTMQCQLGAEDMQRIEASELPAVKFLWRLIRIWQEGRPEHRPILHDPLAVAVTFRPDLIRTVAGRVEVETRGQPGRTYGMTLLRADPNGPVRVASEVDAPQFVKLFVERLLSAPKAPLSSRQ
jgi:inosine-uridine nucleoside N-ribohydrolase